VVRQSTVGEAVLFRRAMFVDHVDEVQAFKDQTPRCDMRTATLAPGSTEVSGQHKSTKGYQTRDIKHLPIPRSTFCSFKHLNTLTQLDSIVVGNISLRRLLPRIPYIGVRERLVLLSRKERSNCVFIGSSQDRLLTSTTISATAEGAQVNHNGYNQNYQISSRCRPSRVRHPGVCQRC
jgi:hypothetical protein